VESKSISQRKGLWAELIVAKYFTIRGWKLDNHRCKINSIEIDLKFSKASKEIFIEVKYLDDPWRSFERLRSKQLNKLKMNLNHVRTKNRSQHYWCYIAFVDYRGHIQFISLDDF